DPSGPGVRSPLVSRASDVKTAVAGCEAVSRGLLRQRRMRDKAAPSCTGVRPARPRLPAENCRSMLQLFRSFFKSKFGIVVTLAFLGLIACALASMDVATTGTFGGISGGDRIAVVGDERIDAAELSMTASNALEQVRQTNPTMTMQAFVAQGGFEDVLEQLLQRTALAEFAREHGMRAGKRLVDSELRQAPGF